MILKLLVCVMYVWSSDWLANFFFDTFSEWLCKYIGTKNKKLLQRLDRIHSAVFRQEFLPCIRFRSNIMGIQTGWYGFRIEDIDMLRKVGMDSERRIMTESDGMEWIQSWGKWQVQRGWDVFKAEDIDRFRRVVMYSELKILTDSDGLGWIQSCVDNYRIIRDGMDSELCGKWQVQRGWDGFRSVENDRFRLVGIDSEWRILTDSDGLLCTQSWGYWQIQTGWDWFRVEDNDRFSGGGMDSELRILTDSDGLGLIQSCGQWKIRRIQICSVKHCPFYSRIVVMIDSNQIGMYILKLWHLQI